MKNRRRGRFRGRSTKNFRLGWMARHRFKWGAIGFALGVAVMFLLWPAPSASGGDVSRWNIGDKVSSLVGAVSVPQIFEGGECRDERGNVLGELSDRDGKVWSLKKYTSTGFAGETLKHCAVSDKAIAISGPGTDFLVDVESGERVRVMGPVDGLWVLAYHTWH